MRRLCCLFFAAAAAVAIAPAQRPQRDAFPYYTPESIASSAHPAGGLAPGTLVSIYGTALSFDTAHVQQSDIHGNRLPTMLAQTQVMVNGLAAPLYYVSPTQVNFLLTVDMSPVPAKIEVFTEGKVGPTVQVALNPVAPALFQSDAEFAVGTRPDGSAATKESPVHPGEVIVLYATGLGDTNPWWSSGELPDRAAWVVARDQFHVQMNGQVLDDHAFFYVGVTPGFAGLYQVNLRLPASMPDNPEIRIGFGDNYSPAGVKLPLTNTSTPTAISQ